MRKKIDKIDIFQVKELLSQGLTRQKIASMLGVSRYTLYLFLKDKDLKAIGSAPRSSQHIQSSTPNNYRVQRIEEKTKTVNKSDSPDVSEKQELSKDEISDMLKNFEDKLLE